MPTTGGGLPNISAPTGGVTTQVPVSNETSNDQIFAPNTMQTNNDFTGLAMADIARSKLEAVKSKLNNQQVNSFINQSKETTTLLTFALIGVVSIFLLRR